MSTFNEVIMLGYLGDAPEVVKTTNTGEASFVRCSIATSEKYRDKTGKLQENTDWNTVYFSNAQAKVAADFLTKGDKILVVGKLRTTSLADKRGVKSYFTAVYARTLKIQSYKQKENKKLNDAESISEEYYSDHDSV